MAFIALDVGNTRSKWAMYDAPHPHAQLLAQGAVFLENIDKLADEDWAQLPVPDRMLGCIVAGEAVRRRVEEQLELWDLTPHWVVSSAREAGLVNGYDHPARLGADRWVAMIGALAHMRAQTSATAAPAHGGGDGRHGCHRGSHICRGCVFRWFDLARPRHHVARLGVGYRGFAGAHWRSA
jgi:hypothetical protein